MKIKINFNKKIVLGFAALFTFFVVQFYPLVVAATSYTLTYIPTTGGSITGSNPQTVTAGGDGTEVTAVPDAGYLFVKWSDDVLTAARTDLTVVGDITVTAEFAGTNDVHVTLDVTSGITISAGADVLMAPNIGVASDSAIGSSSWTVKTNSTNGYTLAVKASASPALVSGGNSFADYHAGGTPATWSVGVGNKEFGYSAYGTDTDTGTWGTAASCGSAGVPDGSQNYAGFSMSNHTIATRAAVTPNAGIATTICFAAAQNSVYAPSGTYTATITATATAL